MSTSSFLFNRPELGPTSTNDYYNEMINPTNTSTIRWPAGSTAVTRGSPIKSGGVVMSAYAVKGHESVTRAHACSHHICYTFGRYARTAHSPS